MEQKNSLTYDIPKTVFTDVEKYCKLNNIVNVSEFIFKCFKQGFDIEKYGLLGENGEIKEIEKEVVKEIIVEKQVPVEIIKEIIVEKQVPVEIIKEVPYEKVVEIIKEIPVEKIITISDDKNKNELLSKIEKLEFSNREKDETISKLKKDLEVKSTQFNNTDKTKLLQDTLNKLKKQNIDLEKEIEQLKEKINQFTSFDNQGKVVYHRGSDINKNLIK